MRTATKPSGDGANDIGLTRLYYPKIMPILKKCGAPKDWGVREVSIIVGFFVMPDFVSAVKSETVGKERKYKFNISKRGQPVFNHPQQAIHAVVFAKMFSDHPATMISALPKIKKIMGRRFTSPQAALEFNAAWTADTGKDLDWLFDGKASAIRHDWRTFQKVGITEKTVEHVRKTIRELSGSSSVKRIPE